MCYTCHEPVTSISLSPLFFKLSPPSLMRKEEGTFHPTTSILVALIKVNPDYKSKLMYVTNNKMLEGPKNNKLILPNPSPLISKMGGESRK